MDIGKGARKETSSVSVETLCELCSSAQILLLVMILVRVQGVTHLLPSRELMDEGCAQTTIAKWEEKYHLSKQHCGGKNLLETVAPAKSPNLIPGTNPTCPGLQGERKREIMG